MKRILVLMGLGCIAWSAGATPAQPDAGLNIVVLTVDDMNCDSIGVFGCPVPGTTPNLDRLAGESIRFRHAHVHASSCVPSRNVMQTGRYLYNSGVEGFYGVPPELVANPTHPEWLKKYGYFVMIRGKESHSTPFYPFPAWDINFKDRLQQMNSSHPDTFYSATREGIEAAQKAGKPFYYNINIKDPHLPLYNWNPKRGEGLGALDRDNPPSRIYGPDEIIVPGFLPDTPLVRRELAAYYSSVRRADDSVGQVLRALKDTGVADNTLLIFFSDHGMPFPFAKTAMWYHSTRTPLMVRWPGVTRGGAVDDTHVVGVVDILPTLCEAAGLPIPGEMDGRSLVEVLRGEKQEGRDYVYVMYEENVGGNRQPTRAVLSRDYGYVYSPWSDGERTFATATRGMASTREIVRLAESGDVDMQARYDLFLHRVPEEFYHYKKDPDALCNLIDDPAQHKRLTTFRARMKAFMVESGDPLLALFEDRGNPRKARDYLSRQDEESRARRANPIYRRKAPKKAKRTTS